MKSVIDNSPKNQFIRSAVFTSATSASLAHSLTSEELLLFAALITPAALVSTSSQDFKKTRLITSTISGLLISDQLLPASNDPKINMAKTAALIGMIYLALSPNRKNRPDPNKPSENKTAWLATPFPRLFFRYANRTPTNRNGKPGSAAARHEVGSASGVNEPREPLNGNMREQVGTRY